MSDLYVSPIDVVVVGPLASALFIANEPREIRECLVGPALAKGCRLFNAESSAPVPKELTVEDVVAAIKSLMEAGDADAFTKGGEPRMDALSKLVPEVTAEQREAAWLIVKAEKEA